MKTSTKISVGLISILAFLSLLSFSSHLYFSFQKAAVDQQLQESYVRESFSPGEITEDIAYLRFLLEKVHPQEIVSFPLGATQPALTELLNSIDRPLTRLEFYRQIAPVGNLLNDEHTMVFPGDADFARLYADEVGLFPLDVQIMNNSLYVTGTSQDEAAIRAGSEIVSINDLPVDSLLENLMTYHSGTGDKQKLFYLQDRFRETLHFVYGRRDRFDLVVVDAGLDEARRQEVSSRAFLAIDPKPFRYEIVDSDTILFTYNAFDDEQGRFAAFLLEMFSTAQRQNIRTLIIDLRDNMGGATAFGDDLLVYLTAESFAQISHVDVTISEEAKDDFLAHVPTWIRWFPVQHLHPMLRPLWKADVGDTATIDFSPIEPGDNALRFAGDVYLLVGPGTMSSASLFAATAKKYGVATLVGEPTGGYATLYGNMSDAYLPNTGLRVSMPTSVVYGNGSGPVVPHHGASQTIPDLVDKSDTVLEFTRRLARREPANQLELP